MYQNFGVGMNVVQITGKKGAGNIIFKERYGRNKAATAQRTGTTLFAHNG
jgi:hypothetical protein